MELKAKNHFVILLKIINQTQLQIKKLGCDPETGDGAGITIQIPDKFIRKEFENLSIDLPKQGSYATGIIFLPSENSLRENILDIINSVIKSSDTGLIRLKDVPTNPDAIGEWSRDAMPSIKQIFIENIKII